MKYKSQLIVLAFSLASLASKAQTDSGQVKKVKEDQRKEQAAKADVYVVDKSIGSTISDGDTTVAAKKVTTTAKKTYNKKHKGKYCQRKYSAKQKSTS